MPQSARLRGLFRHYRVDPQRQWKRREPLYHHLNDQYDPPCRSDSTTRLLSNPHRSLRVDPCQASMAHLLRSRPRPDQTSMLSWPQSPSPSPERSRSVSSVAISRDRIIMLRSFLVNRFPRRMWATLLRCFVILSRQLLIRRGLSSHGCITMSITTSRTSSLAPSNRRPLKVPSQVAWSVQL